MISDHREKIDRVAAVFADALARLGLRPNHVTVLSLVITTAGAGLIATGHLFWGAFVAGVGAPMDLLDGLIARRTDQVTTFGGYLDSLLDRYGDGIAFFAVGWYYATPWIWAAVVAAIVGSLVTSYARARVHEDADPPEGIWADLLERPERLMGLLFPVGFQGIADHFGAGVQFLPWVVVVLAVLSHLTVLQRARRAHRILTGGEP